MAANFCPSSANCAKLGILVLASFVVAWKMSIVGNLNKSEPKFLDCFWFRWFYGLYIPSHHCNFSSGKPISVYKLFLSRSFLAYIVLSFLIWWNTKLELCSSICSSPMSQRKNYWRVFFSAFLFMETVVTEFCIPLQLHQSTRRHETLQICFLNSCKIACNMSIIQIGFFFPFFFFWNVLCFYFIL